MLPVLIQSLLLASTGLLSFGSITLVILLLVSERGWLNGLGYAIGYTTAYALIGTSLVILGYRSAPNADSDTRPILPVLLMILGTFLIVMARRNWRKPGSDNDNEARFFAFIDSITPFKAFGFGAIITVINIKNMGLFLTALSVVIVSDLLIAEKLVITFLVVAVFCVSVSMPVIIYVSFPKNARAVLNSLRGYINQHGRPIGIWMPLVYGLFLLIKGVMDLL